VKKRIIGFLVLITFFSGFIGIKKYLDATTASTGRLNFFNKAMVWFVKEVEKAEERTKQIARKIGYLVTAPFIKTVNRTHSAVYGNPYAYIPARVRIEDDVFSPEEKAYLSVRKPFVKKSLEEFIGITIPEGLELPNMMVSLSGGGSRAMLHSWSVMRAFDKMGLLNAISHVSSLSGSTWFLWPWLISGMTLEQYEDKLLSGVVGGFVPRAASFVVPIGTKAFKKSINTHKIITEFFVRELVFNRDVTPIDIYGVVLGLILFEGFGENNDPLQVYMDPLYPNLDSGTIPYPILTTISIPDVRWFTATPYEFGASSLGAYVPIWGVDRKFKDGVSVGMVPYPDRVGLSGFIAMSAAAMAASLGDIYFNLFSGIKEGKIKTLLQAIMEQSPLERLRFFYYERSNFLYGVPGLPIYDSLSGKTWGDVKSIKYTDAGVIWVNPIPPLLDRMKPKVPTILIVQDASAKVGYPRLKDAKAYADGENPRKKRFSFPELQKEFPYNKKGMSILQNDDVLIFYFPRIIDRELIQKNESNPELQSLIQRQNFDMDQRLASVYSTFKLQYTEDNARDLTAVGMFNVLANKEKIRETIKQFVQRYIQRSQ